MPALRRRIALLTGFLAQARRQSSNVIRNRSDMKKGSIVMIHAKYAERIFVKFATSLALTALGFGSSSAQSTDSVSAGHMTVIAPTLGAVVRPEFGFLIGASLEFRSSIEPSLAVDYLRLADFSGAFVRAEVATRAKGVVGGFGLASAPSIDAEFAIARIGYETSTGFGLDLRYFHRSEESFWTLAIRPFTVRM